MRSADDPQAVAADAREAAGLERPPLLLLRPLEAFLEAHGFATGPIEAEPVGDGHSNVTYLIRSGDQEWVLRRPPRGPLPPSAHDVLREFRILEACAPTAVRVPMPLLACEDLTVIGAPFYLMSYVPGEVLSNALPEVFDPVLDPSRIIDELIAALAEIHSLDWRATGLATMAPAPEQYLDRQLAQFAKRWRLHRTRELPAVEKVAEWLARNRPASSDSTLVHGDYRLGNMIFASSSPPRLDAVLDWEMATIGDPLADVGYLSATYAVPGEGGDPLVRLGAVTAGAAFPPRSEVIERYAAATGRDVSDLVWYEALALWKSAVFLEGSYGRLLSGSTDDPFFTELAAGVPELAERAWALARTSGRA